MDEDKSSVCFYVSGIVQGVGYRYFTRSAAVRLGLWGYIRNLHDGRVEVYASGTTAALEAFRADLAHGPDGASVSGIVEEEALPNARFAGTFSIERDE